MLLAVCQEFGLESEGIPQIAFCFAGGFGNTGAVCGAVCGAMMALGLKLRKTDSVEDESLDETLRPLAVAQEFRRRFEAEMGTISCRELIGVDLTTKEGIEQLMNSDKPMTVCFPAVGLAYQIVMDLLQASA